jgi:hypothetical protein
MPLALEPQPDDAIAQKAMTPAHNNDFMGAA